MLKIKEEVNVFYPSNIYPYNNVSVYGFRQSDQLNYEFEKDDFIIIFYKQKSDL